MSGGRRELPNVRRVRVIEATRFASDGLGTRRGIASPTLRVTWFVLLCGLLSVASAETYTPGKKVDKDFDGFAKSFLVSHCVDCHGKTDPEGNLSLEELGPVDEVNAATWKSVWALVALKEMPPKDADQPHVVQRLLFSDWIVDELTRVMHDKGGFRSHLDPDKGNFVDHDLLFGLLPESIKLQPPSSPARIWRVTPQEHITRLNELINKEPEFDPKNPGLRTHGDAVPTNHGGELKLYFGTDNIVQWQGGTVAYATAVKSVPVVLASARHHGLENYPDLYSVNSAEATQIMGVAEDIIRYMAYGPLSIAEPYQITDDPKSIADKMKGDLRGLPTSLVYSTKVLRPLTPVYELMKDDGVTDARLRTAVDDLFEALTFRPPTKTESDSYLTIVKQSIEKLGKEDGVVLGLSSIFLDRDALFRPELATSGTPDQHGRVMLQDWELGLAVNHALRYIKPDDALRKAIVEGRMRTRADVQREVERMLAAESIRKPRVLQFFRDYFDYDLGGYICKDGKALADSGASAKGMSHYGAMFDASASTDRLIELILAEDKDVLKQLLTTNKVVATKEDNVYFGERLSREQSQAPVAAAKQADAEATQTGAAEIEALEKGVAELEARLTANPGEKRTQNSLARKKKLLETAKNQATAAKRKKRTNANDGVAEANLSGPNESARVSRRSFGSGSMKPERILATVPEGQRLGLLTHPSWLVSHSDAMDNHAIRRGKWIRERLLGGGIPDVPITVDAMLPDEPNNTLRERMRVTRETYCWTCHQRMDPLGLPFEMYNHAGLFRTTELGKPVDTKGEIINSGDPALDGKVANAIELIQKLAESQRAEQVFVRHAFRFWMGRNETLNDAPMLQAAYQAYKDNGGSMNALLTSLLTSDAFLYRTRSEALPHPKTTQIEPNGFFTLGRRKDHWWLITPDGRPFFSMGLNHIDPASLRYPENIHVWREKYGGSTIRWIEESVVQNLRTWGFNTVGWVQEVTVRQWRHSRAFTIDEYRALDMPYCHLLPFTESHQWEKHTVHFDFRSEDWKEWCDYVARAHCAELANEKNLIGYFYSDCPNWTHTRPDNEWRGPIFDPERLSTEAGRRELSELATSYYQTTHDAIRRHDKHHLILGDRYEANAPIAMEVITAALPLLDVLSFQDFRDPVKHLHEWHEKTGKPVLLADAARINWQTVPGEFTPNDGQWYAETFSALFENPGCIGFHLCGAHQRNKARRYGLLDELERPDTENVNQMKTANEEIRRQMSSKF